MEQTHRPYFMHVALLQKLLSQWGGVQNLSGKRILDLACGAVTTQDNSIGDPRYFEPWIPRGLLAFNAIPVGVDFNDLESEMFEHYQCDLIQPGALDFLESGSFDAVHMDQLFDSPEFQGLLKRVGVAKSAVISELKSQIKRLLKPEGLDLTELR